MLVDRHWIQFGREVKSGYENVQSVWASNSQKHIGNYRWSCTRFDRSLHLGADKTSKFSWFVLKDFFFSSQTFSWNVSKILIQISKKLLLISWPHLTQTSIISFSNRLINVCLIFDQLFNIRGSNIFRFLQILYEISTIIPSDKPYINKAEQQERIKRHPPARACEVLGVTTTTPNTKEKAHFRWRS